MEEIMYYLILGLLENTEGILEAIEAINNDPEKKATIKATFAELMADPEIRAAFVALFLT